MRNVICIQELQGHFSPLVGGVAAVRGFHVIARMSEVAGRHWATDSKTALELTQYCTQSVAKCNIKGVTAKM